LTVPLKRLKV